MKSLYLIIALVCFSKATLPDCTGCIGGSSGPCKASSDVCYPQNGDDTCPAGTSPCGAAVKKYACNLGQCTEGSTGQYDTLSDC